MKLILVFLVVSAPLWGKNHAETFEVPLIKAMTYTGRIAAATKNSLNYKIYVTHQENIVSVVLKLKDGHVENLAERDSLAQAVIDEIAKIKNKYNDQLITVRAVL